MAFADEIGAEIRIVADAGLKLRGRNASSLPSRERGKIDRRRMVREG